MRPGELLRQVYDAPEVTLLASIQDALTGRLAELAGIPAAVLGGATVTNALLGMPDWGLLTLTEMEMVLARTTAACTIPVVVDVDNGYGNAINVYRTVRTLERAGGAGVYLEDQQHPPKGGYIGERVVSSAEMVGKIKAAVDARADDSFVVVARTDARPTEGLDATIERGQAYVAAGADGFFATQLLSFDEIGRVRAAVPAIYHLGHLGGLSASPTGPKPTLAEWGSLGFCAVTTGTAPVRAGALTTLRYFERAAAGVDTSVDYAAASAGSPLSEWNRFTGFDWVKALEHRYLPGGQGGGA